MNINDVLKYGHETLVKSVDGLPDTSWEVSGVCGRWSVKNIIAHLASYEHLLVDVLNTLTSAEATPYLEKMGQLRGGFNDAEVDARTGKSPAETMQEYLETYAHMLTVLSKVPTETAKQAGALPWYGTEYDLEDFVVYTFYGHKREHAAQIAVFRDSLQ